MHIKLNFTMFYLVTLHFVSMLSASFNDDVIIKRVGHLLNQYIKYQVIFKYFANKIYIIVPVKSGFFERLIYMSLTKKDHQ